MSTPRTAAGAARLHETPAPATINFGDFHLDFLRGQLRRGSRPIPLRPKTWRVLHYLAERPGELVSKGDLLDAVWPDVTVTEWVLSKSIRELRVAFDDDSKTPRLIETVQRRGFRFIAPIGTAEPSPHPDVVPSPITGLASAPRAPFVGRAEELTRLSAAFANALRGERATVFVSGEAGIGKTALVGTFLESMAVAGADVPLWIARGTCVGQHGAREAYMPVLEAIEGLAGRPAAGRLAELLRRVAPTWLAQMPALISDADHQALRQSLHGVKPERMLREFAALIETLTAEVAVVLVLEDLHWGDASTIDLLWTLAQRREPARLLVIGTFRPADAIVQEHVLMNVMRTLAVHRQCVELTVPYLREADVQRYFDERFPGNDFPPSLARVIHRHTDGNPLFMTGAIDHLLLQGIILDTAPGWALCAPPEAIPLDIPDDVRLLIDNDLETVSPADRSLLQAASVAGEDFTPLVVAETLGCEVADVEMRCEAFVQARRFLRVTGHVEWPDHSISRRYGFVHELYRQAVYARIAEDRCMQLHRRIGQALEHAYGARQTEIAPQLAIHFERGRDGAQALRYLSVAAEQARARFANREALQYLDAALALLTYLPEDDERRRRELELRLARGAILIDLRGFASDEVRESFADAGALCATVGTRPQLFGILYARWYVHSMRSERDEALAMGAQLDDLARRLGTAPHRALAASVLVRTACYDARFDEAIRIMQRRLARVESPMGAAPPAFGPDPVMAAATHSALAVWFVGDPERARAIARATVARARAQGHVFTLSAILVQAALLELLCRNAASGSGLVQEAVSLSTTHGFAYWQAYGTLLNGWALTQQDRAAEGKAAISAGLAAILGSGGRYFLAFAYGFLAESQLRLGALEDGLAAADAGLAVAQATLDRAYTAELWRLKGELLFAAETQTPRAKGQGAPSPRQARTSRVQGSRSTEAETCFQHALDSSRATQARSLELRAATSLARAWHARGRTAPARRLLADICGWFGTRVTSPDLADARALRDEIGPPPRKSPNRG